MVTLMKIDSRKKLEEIARKAGKERQDRECEVLVCAGTGCLANGAAEIVEAFQKSIKEKKVNGLTVEAVKETGCHGFCQMGPLLIIQPDNIFYVLLKPRDAKALVETHLSKNEMKQLRNRRQCQEAVIQVDDFSESYFK